MKFNGEDLEFDRKASCDWCGRKKLVGITHYGTSNYNRLICKECAEEIKEYNKNIFGIEDSVNKKSVKQIYRELMKGYNEDLPNNIKKVFKDIPNSSIKLNVLRNCIKFDGNIQGKTLGGVIYFSNLEDGVLLLAEDIAHFAYGYEYYQTEKGYYDSKKNFKDSTGSEPVIILRNVLPNLYRELKKLSEKLESEFRVREEYFNDDSFRIYLYDDTENYNSDSAYEIYEITGKWPDYEERLDNAFSKDGGEYIEWENRVVMSLVFKNKNVENKVLYTIERYIDTPFEDSSKIKDSKESKDGMLITNHSWQDIIRIYLQWEGLFGYDNDIIDFLENDDEEGLKDYCEEEGIWGYEQELIWIKEDEEAFCLGMEKEDYIAICKQQGIDPVI